jgi:very-short-patch-repair endonuclease
MHGCHFRRQAPIGPDIAEFVCFDRQLIIGLDGSLHAVRTEEDQRRTIRLESQGFRVLRFWNHVVFEDLDLVMEIIWQTLKDRAPS